MRKVMVLLLSLVLSLAILAPAAFAGRCAETGDCGTGTGAGGGGGYVQRSSGLWVPNRDGYIQQRTPPVSPAVKDFGGDVAKDVVKGAAKAAGAAVAVGAGAAAKGVASDSGSWWTFIQTFAGPILF